MGHKNKKDDNKPDTIEVVNMIVNIGLLVVAILALILK